MAVGKSNRKIDAIDKALGREKFTDDIVLPRMLHCKIKRSIKAHAKIKNINTKQALKLDGVFEIITGQDFNIKYGVIPWTKDEYPLARDKVTYVGEGVAAVAAISEQVANKALKLIKIEYED